MKESHEYLERNHFDTSGFWRRRYNAFVTFCLTFGSPLGCNISHLFGRHHIVPATPDHSSILPSSSQQPPLQFYLRTIASQPWSDVTILTYTSTPDQLNPAFATLEMMQRTGVLGPNVVTHKARLGISRPPSVAHNPK